MTSTDSAPITADATVLPKPVTPTVAERRRRTARIHRWTRYVIQIMFFILAPGTFAGAFNGVKYLFDQIGAIQPIEATSFVMLLMALLAFTVLFGRFFCGYACAFGTLGDVLYDAFDFLRSKTPIPRITFPRTLVKALSLVKYLILGAICVACALGAWSLVSGISPWIAFAAATNGSFDGIAVGSVVLLALVMLGMIMRERFFCQFLCPLGAVFSLMPVLGFSQFTRVRSRCARNCGRCEASCPVSIWPDADKLASGECLSCGRCADACPMGNVSLIVHDQPASRISRPSVETADTPLPDERVNGHIADTSEVERARWAHDKSSDPLKLPTPENTATQSSRKERTARLLVRGTEAPIVIAKAAALLVVLWILGATRYLPTFGSPFG